MRTIYAIAIVMLVACSHNDQPTNRDAAERWALALCSQLAMCMPDQVQDIGACIDGIVPELLQSCVDIGPGDTVCTPIDGALSYQGNIDALDRCIDRFEAQGCAVDFAGCWSL